MEKDGLVFCSIGEFDCSRNHLISLEGAPQIVSRSFDCSWNELTSLKDAPQKVNRMFICSHNNLTSLEGSPKTIEAEFVFFYLLTFKTFFF